MGDFEKKQLRAMTTIEKDQEIQVLYRNTPEFYFNSREFRQQYLLENLGFQCLCSECCLEEEALEENERMRTEIREKKEEILQLSSWDGSDPVPRRNFKKALKLTQQRMKLIQKLDLRAAFVHVMIDFYLSATWAKGLDISILKNDPDIFKQEALKYAKLYGDNYIHQYNQGVDIYGEDQM